MPTKQLYKQLYLTRDIRAKVGEREVIGIATSTSSKLEVIRFIQKVVINLEGNIYISGKNTKPRYREELKPTGKVKENVDIQDFLTGRENINLILKDTRKKHDEKLDKYIDILGLTKILDKQASEYSIVELQKLDIIRALIYDAKVLVLDSPDCCKDLKDKKALRKITQKLMKNSDIIIFFVSDDYKNLTSNCNRIVIFENNQIDKIFVSGSFEQIEEQEACQSK